jgi:hypothetical protein
MRSDGAEDFNGLIELGELYGAEDLNGLIGWGDLNLPERSVTGRQIEKDRQTDRQTDKYTDRQVYRYTDRHICR